MGDLRTVAPDRIRCCVRAAAAVAVCVGLTLWHYLQAFEVGQLIIVETIILSTWAAVEYADARFRELARSTVRLSRADVEGMLEEAPGLTTAEVVNFRRR
jgi:hypothetical protein